MPTHENPVARQRHGIGKEKDHDHFCHIPIDLQVFIAALAPWYLTVLLLAIAGMPI
jgi:hypothetical protein